MLQFGYNTGVINAPEQVISSFELAKQQLEMGNHLMLIFLIICLIHFNIKVLIKFD